MINFNRKKELQWDEKAIEEQSQDRGNKMIIDEPKTPYNDQEIMEEDEIQQIEETGEDKIKVDKLLEQANQNRQMLQQQQQKKIDLEELNKRFQAELERQRREMGSDSDSEEEKQNRKKKEEFAKKRNMHYNEKNKIKAAMSKKSNFNDEA